MTLLKRHILLLSTALLVQWTLLTSCSYVTDECYPSCGITLEYKPYVQTPCMDSPSYPEDIKQMLVVVTDEKGQIVAHRTFQEVALSPDTIYSLNVPYGKYETLTSRFWVNALPSDYSVAPEIAENKNYADYSLSVITNPTHFLMAKQLPILYYGEITLDSLSDRMRNIDEPFHHELSPNLTRYTNDFTVKVKGLEHDRTFFFDITDTNGTYNFDGEVLNQDIVYRKEIKQPEDDTFQISTLRLDLPNTRPTLSLTTTVNGSKKNIIPEDGRDLKALLDKVPNKKLACDFVHELEITVIPGYDNTNMSIDIKIDGWGVYSHDIIL